MRNKTEPMALSLFSGAGGLDLGVQAAGFKVYSALDNDAACCGTLRKNFPETRVVERDIREVSSKELLPPEGAGDVDLVVGGPPCQAFTILGNRSSFSDPRGALVFTFGEIVSSVGADAFVFENVSGILSLGDGDDFSELTDYFSDIGYHIEHAVLNALNYGVPQRRERVFVVGFKDPESLAKFSFPESLDEERPSQLVGPYRETVSEAFSGIEPDAPNHEERDHTDRVTARYMELEPGARDPVDFCDRLEEDQPSGTVIVGSGGGGGRPFVHPTEPRQITVREAARLQSFPDSFVFVGSKSDQYHQVGNAVPPRMGYAVANRIRSVIARPSKVPQI